MTAQTKHIVTQLSRDERLEAFEMFDGNGDGEVKEIKDFNPRYEIIILPHCFSKFNSHIVIN